MTNEPRLTAQAAQPPAPRPGLILAGFLASLIMAGTAAFRAVTRHGVPWPFHGAPSPAETWGRVLVYLPVVFFALASLAWLKGGTRLKERLSWTRFSTTFPAGFLVSAAYALYLFLTHDFGFKGVAFFPPALLLACLNSLSEEILYRVVLLNLLMAWSGSFNRSNLIQALIYGGVHLVIGGPVFFLAAAAYGYLLGLITRTNESVLPALICHTLADIGAVSLPLLIIVS
ncbi:hypothetical protein JCM14469_09560 [Desulfatiferula olefinivorans]